jgi:hypothetical protein
MNNEQIKVNADAAKAAQGIHVLAKPAGPQIESTCIASCGGTDERQA